MNYIVDIHDLVHQYADLPAMYDIYRYFTLQDMIQSLITPVPDYKQVFWDRCEHQLGDVLDLVDLNLLELHIDGLAMDLDRLMIRAVSPDFVHTDYMFRQWVNSTTLIIGDVRERDYS